jgi:5,10-methylenetetrahydromethanopterin reductase
MTAAAMATLQEHSDGRAMLGLGAGSPIVLDPLGADQSDPVGTVRDATKAVRGLVAGEEVTVEGPSFSLSGASLDFVPGGDVPVYVAGRGPGLLGLGGYRGDGVLAGAGLASPDGMEYAFERVASGAEKRGRSLDDVDVVCWAWLSVADDREAALEGVAPLAAKVVNKTPMRALTAIGIDRADAEVVKGTDVGAMDASELRAALPDAVIEQFAVAGTPAECAAHVDRLADVGVDHVGLLAFDNPERDRLASLEAFADTVF